MRWFRELRSMKASEFTPGPTSAALDSSFSSIWTRKRHSLLLAMLAVGMRPYQFAALNFKVRPKWMLDMGYRYMFIDFRTRNALWNMVTSGALLGLTCRFK